MLLMATLKIRHLLFVRHVLWQRCWMKEGSVGWNSQASTIKNWSSEEKRASRKVETTSLTAATANWQCDECGRKCESCMGLLGHQRVHKKKDWRRKSFVYLVYMQKENLTMIYSFISCSCTWMFAFIHLC